MRLSKTWITTLLTTMLISTAPHAGVTYGTTGNNIKEAADAYVRLTIVIARNVERCHSAVIVFGQEAYDGENMNPSCQKVMNAVSERTKIMEPIDVDITKKSRADWNRLIKIANRKYGSSSRKNGETNRKIRELYNAAKDRWKDKSKQNPKPKEHDDEWLHPTIPDDGKQPQRLAMIKKLIQKGFYLKIEQPSTLPRAYVGPLFWQANIDQKKTLLGATLNYYQINNRKASILILKDSMTGKEIGKFSSNGLDLD